MLSSLAPRISRYSRTSKAFTLVELLVVIAVIAILSVTAMVFFGNVPAKARDARRKANVDSIAKALELKYTKNGAYSDLVASDFSKGGAEALNDARITRTIAADGESFTVCAALETTTTPVCVNSSLGGAAVAGGVPAGQPTPTPILPTPVPVLPTPTPVVPTPTPVLPTPTPVLSSVPCPAFNNTTSQICKFGNPIPTSSVVYMKCDDITKAIPWGTTINCTTRSPCWLPDGSPHFIDWYADATTATKNWPVAFISKSCSKLPEFTVKIRD